MSNLYWRNTKESVKDEYTIPDYIEDLILLDFTGLSLFYAFLLQLLII